MTAENEEWDVMISYNWNTGKEYANDLYKVLTENRYKVWIDQKNMAGDLNSEMAKGVANSKIILLLISEEYKNSPNCEKEYTHADHCKKIIIPIYVENYKPPLSSKLAIIISGKIYYELYENKEKKLNEILKAIQKLIGKRDKPIAYDTESPMKPPSEAEANKPIAYDTESSMKPPSEAETSFFENNEVVTTNAKSSPNAKELNDPSEPNEGKQQTEDSFKNLDISIGRTYLIKNYEIANHKRLNEVLTERLNSTQWNLSYLTPELNDKDVITNLANEFELNQNTINHIFLATFGGGNHASEMINILRITQPNLLTDTLIEKLKDTGYLAAAELIKSSGCKNFSDIKPILLKKLSDELLNEGIQYPKVIDLARSLGIDVRGIGSIKKAQQASDCYSYIDQFLKNLSREQPEITVERFMEALNKCSQSAFQVFAKLVYEKISC